MRTLTDNSVQKNKMGTVTDNTCYDFGEKISCDCIILLQATSKYQKQLFY